MFSRFHGYWDSEAKVQVDLQGPQQPVTRLGHLVRHRL